MKLKEMLKTMEDFGKKNAPAIATGVAMFGVVATAVSANKAVIKATEIVKEQKQKMADIKPADTKARRELYFETAKRLVPVVLPPVIMGFATEGCILTSNRISSKRIAVLSAVYNLTESKLRDVNETMAEVLGAKKTKEVKDAISKKNLDKNPIPSEDKIIVTGQGDVLCRDGYSGRTFYSNGEKIDRAINELTHQVYGDMYVSLNEFYDKLGLENIPLGDDFGWNVDDISGGTLPISFTAHLTEDRRPCLCIEYDVRLRDDFRNLH